MFDEDGVGCGCICSGALLGQKESGLEGKVRNAIEGHYYKPEPSATPTPPPRARFFLCICFNLISLLNPFEIRSLSFHTLHFLNACCTTVRSMGKFMPCRRPYPPSSMQMQYSYCRKGSATTTRVCCFAPTLFPPWRTTQSCTLIELLRQHCRRHGDSASADIAAGESKMTPARSQGATVE